MTETHTMDRSQLLNADDIRTVNSGFSIPVIDSYMNIEDPQTVRVHAGKLRKRITEGLGCLELLVIDEYMMTSALEVVYIDAVLRIINHQPEIPFGGVIVIFLGDNRQNSSIPMAQPTVGVTHADDQEEDDITLNSEARRMSHLLLAMIKETFKMSWWASPAGAKGLALALLNTIPKRRFKVTTKINSMLEMADGDINTTVTTDIPHDPDDTMAEDDLNLRTEHLDGNEEDLFEFETWSDDTVNLVCRAVEMAEKGEKDSSPVEEFAQRFWRIARANVGAVPVEEDGDDDDDDDDADDLE